MSSPLLGLGCRSLCCSALALGKGPTLCRLTMAQCDGEPPKVSSARGSCAGDAVDARERKR